MTSNACAMATAVLMVTVAVLMAGAPGLAQDVDGVVYIDGPVNVTLTNDIFPLCTPTLDDLPEDATAEDVEALQSVFEEQAASVLDRFVPCAFGSPVRPSWRCCRSLASIFGFYEEADFPNCLCAPGIWDALLAGFAGRFDIVTLYNRCAASFPNGFVVNFNSTATPQSEAVSRCTSDRVNIDPDYVNPFADVDVSEFLSTNDQEAVADAIEQEILSRGPGAP